MTGALVEHVDLYPSLAEIAGVPVDKTLESIDGESWASLLDDPAAHWEQPRPSVLPSTLVISPDGTLEDVLVGPQTYEDLARAVGMTSEV